MSGFVYAIAVYFIFSIVGSLFFYWAVSPELISAIDFLPARALLSIFFGFVFGHAILMAYVFFTSKSFDVIISRSWLVFLSLIALIATSKTFCFGSPPIIQGSPTRGISIQWTSAACAMDGNNIFALLILTVALLLVILLKYLSDDFSKREGARMLSEILRRR
jgi:hypothetical protein